MADEPNDQNQQQGPPAAPKPAPPAGERGFPENTPVQEMTDGQRAEYYKSMSRKWEDRAKARDDYDDLKQKASEFDKLRESQQSEQERAVAQARAEGASEAAKAAADRTAATVMRTLLTSAGREPETAAALVKATNLAAFIRDGDVDVDALAEHVKLIAPAPVKEPAWSGDLGQGRRTTTKTTGTSLGRDMFADRRKPAPNTP